MSSADRLLYLCTCVQPDANRMQRIDALAQRRDLDWDYFLWVAEDHKVAPLIHANLQKRDSQMVLPNRVISRLQRAYMDNVFRKKGSLQLLSSVLAYLNSRQIDVMLVKGVAYNAVLYPHPWYVVSADIDLLFRKREAAFDSAELNALKHYLHTYNRQEAKYKEPFEFDFFEHHDINMNGIVDIDFNQVWRDARRETVAEHDVFIMSPEDMLIGAAVNACRKRYLRLNAMLPIATLAGNGAIDWARFASKVREYRAGPIVYAALRATIETLGAAVPETVWRDLAVPSWRAGLMDRTLRRLLQNHDLETLNRGTEFRVRGRNMSRMLFLTYASHGWIHLGRRLAHIAKDNMLKPRPETGARQMPTVIPDPDADST